MNVLAIDTATDEAAVALRTGERTRVRRLGWRTSFTETAPAIEALLEEAGTAWEDLAAIAVPAGPGSFTGLRVGAAIALGIGESRAIPLHAVPTLAAVAEAHAGFDDERVCASIDARRGRRYVAVYERERGGWRRVVGPEDVPPGEVAGIAGGTPVVGPNLDPRHEAPPTIAEAVVALVARDPDRYRLATPGALRLIYARPGVDRSEKADRPAHPHGG